MSQHLLTSLSNFQENVAQICRDSSAPGLTCGVLHRGRVVTAAAGVLSLETGVEARPDSLFQIGSITKSLTATLVMQAAEERLIDIDAPVREILKLRVGRGDAADRFTARQLMAHMSGLDGDLFIESGRDDDALAKYMILCRQLEFLATPGRYYNYSNAGYAVLGRLVEVLRRDVYDRVLDRELFGRIGATRSTTMPEIATYRRTATGHGPGADGKMAIVPAIHLPRGLGPAGLSLYSTVEDLLAYARAHMDGGKLVSKDTAQQMRKPHIALPENASWGLGWKLIQTDRTLYVGHDGGTIGQAASLWTAPAHGLAVAMCSNGGLTKKAWQAIAYPVFREVCGDVPESILPDYAPAPRDLSLYEGAYENSGVTFEIEPEGDVLKATARQKYFSMPDVTLVLRSVGEDRFRTAIGDDDRVVTQFLDSDGRGRPGLFYAGRLHRRVAA